MRSPLLEKWPPANGRRGEQGANSLIEYIIREVAPCSIAPRRDPDPRAGSFPLIRVLAVCSTVAVRAAT